MLMTQPNYSYRAIDAMGCEIILERSAERIVCLTATGVDSLLELNLEPVGYLANGIALSS
jgi:iron complex transport system substrate-binding protein